MNGMYEELLEKLRKNNRMSGWTHIDRLIDEATEAIEALQQENNGWQERYYELDAGHSRLFKDFCKLQKENEQLQAQLDEWKYEVKCHMDEVIAREKQIEQLRVRVARMRELLTKAYDEIEKYKCLWKGSKPSGCDCPKPTALQDEIEQTLAEIDKVMGGKEW
jgi:chromosome segregation ATPase